jgi:hypothetical protein
MARAETKKKDESSSGSVIMQQMVGYMSRHFIYQPD